MNPLKKVFRGRHVFLPVIHVEGGAQALRNARIACAEGADGVFLIYHNITHPQILECYEHVRNHLPQLWIGVNLLDLGRSAIHSIPLHVAGLWTHNAGISETGEKTAEAEAFDEHRKKIGWDGLYFGGVAFKYQQEVLDIDYVCKLALPFVDVITTSGVATGEAADLAKIKRMRRAIGDHPLAIASGITPDNVGQYMPYANCFLVATGISTSHTELDPAKVRALSKALGR